MSRPSGAATARLVNGKRGNDSAALGAGDDTFQWDPGDGSDTIDGEAGTDTMLFNGANVAETIDMSANGSRLRFTRNVANIVMDTSGVEHVRFNARGGVDLIPVAVHMLHADATDRLDVSSLVRPATSTSSAVPVTDAAPTTSTRRRCPRRLQG